MTDVRRWVLMSLLVACVIGLIIWARGTAHHRGQDVGALGGSHVVAGTWRV